MGQSAEKRQKEQWEQAEGKKKEAGRRKKEKIVKLNQMTALRIQTSDIPGLPSGKINECKCK